MKKTIVCCMLLGCLLTSGFMGCSSPMLEKSSDIQVDYQKETEILSLLEKTKINLPAEISIEKIGVTKDFYINNLTSRAAMKFHRSVVPEEVVMEEDELINILETSISNYEIPELITPSNEDLKKISALLPDLTDEEIIENLNTIGKIYQNIVVANIDDDIIEKIQESSFARYSKYSVGGAVITIHEIAACLKHPFSAISLQTQKDNAESYTTKYMGTGEGLNTKKDAFRHAILNVALAKEGWGLKDEKLSWAYDIGTAHEQGARYVEKESEMDLHNNEVGRNIYDLNSPKTYGSFLWWTVETGVDEKNYDFYCSIIKNRLNSAVFVDKKLSFQNVLNNIQNQDKKTLVYIVK